MLGDLFTTGPVPTYGNLGFQDAFPNLDTSTLGVTPGDRIFATHDPTAMVKAVNDIGQANRFLALQSVGDAESDARSVKTRILGSLAPSAIQAATGINLESAQRSRNRVQQLIDQFLPQVAQQRREAFKAAQLAPLQAAMQAAQLTAEAQKFNSQSYTGAMNSMITSGEKLQSDAISSAQRDETIAMQMLKQNPYADEQWFADRGVDRASVIQARRAYDEAKALDARRVAAAETSAGNSGSYRDTQNAGIVRSSYDNYLTARTTVNDTLANHLYAHSATLLNNPKLRALLGGLGISDGGSVGVSEIKKRLEDPSYAGVRQTIIDRLPGGPTVEAVRKAFSDEDSAKSAATRRAVGHDKDELSALTGLPMSAIEELTALPDNAGSSSQQVGPTGSADEILKDEAALFMEKLEREQFCRDNPGLCNP